ncbi:MAG: class A beta-lactamase [Pseudomonadota bacterium]
MASPLHEVIGELEERLDARIGVAVVDSGSGKTWHHRGEERFPLTSTFKPLACAAVLARVDAGSEKLSREVEVRQEELVTYSPFTQDFVGSTITLADACEAAITLSDNTAGNLLLAAIGGPPGLTAFLRKSGDRYTRLDRTEPDLNEATPNDPRDTTTPIAIAHTLAALLQGGALSDTQAQRLESWMIADRVADALFRSRLPAGWGIADKSGAGGYGSRALIAVLYPPDGAAVFAAVYVTQTEASFAARNSAIADIGAAIFSAVIASEPTAQNE